MKSFTVILAVALLSFGCLVGMAQADIVTNGTFDTDLSGWTPGGSGLGFNTGDNPPNPPSCYMRSGDSNMRQPTGYIIKAGDVIDLSFVAANIQGDVTKSATIKGQLLFDDGTKWADLMDTGVIDLPGIVTPDWQTYNLSFTALDGQSYIGTELAVRFEKTGANAFVGIDDVSCNVTSTPEPSAIILVGTGLFGLLAYAWRKRK